MTKVTDPALLAVLNGGPPAASQPTVIQLPPTQEEVRRGAREDRGEAREDRREGRDVENKGGEFLLKIANDYNADPAVKAYRVAIGQFAQALGTGSGAQADLALTYAFAKAMDPDSVVREAEQGMVTESQPWFQATVERAKKQFGMDGAGNYTPETREALRKQISNSVAQRAKVYDARRNYYEQQAGAIGVDPRVVIGEHDAVPFLPAIQGWADRVNNVDAGEGAEAPPRGPPTSNEAPDGQVLLGYGQNEDGAPYPIYGEPGTTPDGQWQAPAYQAISGVNEGIASTLGLPIDIPNLLDTGMVRGANALFGTDLKTADEVARTTTGEDSLGSGGWWQNRSKDWGLAGPPPTTGTGAFLRRTGQSVGAAAVPLLGAGGSLGKTALGGLASAGGGAGAATAQQVLPGNPAAEFAGEMLGSVGVGGPMAIAGRATRQNAANAAVPTTQQLRDQAGQIYRQAEARGVTADPAQTQDLADAMRMTLARDGRVSPTGRISEVYPKAREGMQLIDDYAGQPMSPTQLQTARAVIADGLASADRSERRIAGNLLDTFDNWAQPLAPELPQARDIASRYLTAEKLEQARELAGSRAGQFTGSGFENALRTEYRALDRAAIKGSQRFSDDVTGAIEDVSRGTPYSNTMRAIGRFAPTGPVSAGLGIGGPATLGAYLGGPAGAVALGGGAALVSGGARQLATRAGINNATRAEMIARNGGRLAEVPLMNAETERLMLALLAAQGVNKPEEGGGAQQPQGFSGGVGRPPARPRGLFGAPR